MCQLGIRSAGGAIGGATSAVLSQGIIRVLDPSGAPLDQGQVAMLAALSGWSGGGQLSIAGTGANGAPIFQRLDSNGSPTGTFIGLNSAGNQVSVSSPFANGNSYSSGPTTLYGLSDAEGNFLKWGISNTPGSRYTGAQLSGGYLDPINTFDSRSLAASIERYFTETQPGSLNMEPWAGKANPAHPNYVPKGVPPK